MAQSPYTVPLPGGVPSTHKEHTESRTTILLPNDNSAFLNPPQQFNRDLSVAVIRAWNERRIEEGEKRFRVNMEKKAKKAKGSKKQGEVEGETVQGEGVGDAGPSTLPRYIPRNIKILEALSATGLRSIRYAKEIPGVKLVLANDISPTACEAMRMNVDYNGVGEGQAPAEGEGEGEGEEKTRNVIVADENGQLPHGRRPGCKGRVRVNEGDACSFMYSHRDKRNQVEVVDLDPYGTAAPFIDGAIQSIADGGLLCVTCTDVSVLAGAQFPEKAFSNYGGASVSAEYCHEAGLRLVLNSLSVAAARYGRAITPLLSLSIDFYVRVFVTVETSAIRVKDAASNTGIVYVCSHCQSWELQPFGRKVEDRGKVHKSAQNTVKSHLCQHCGAVKHVGGPMWLGPIQDREFAERALKSIEGQQEDYGTWKRMHGMLSLAAQELDTPFYFTCNKLSSFFRASAAPVAKTVAGLLNAGYKVSRSHASAGSIKTDAPRDFVLDVFREWIKESPVRVDKIADGNHAKDLNAKPQTHTVDFTPHPGMAAFERGEKVFYQNNPLPNWGPAARARNSKLDGEETAEGENEKEDGKRKADAQDEREEKRAKIEEEAVNA